MELVVLIIVALCCVFIEYKESIFKNFFSYYYKDFVTIKLPNKKQYKLKFNDLLLVLLFSLILMLFSCRDLTVGTDTSTYKLMFDSFDIYNPDWHGEPVFWLLVYFVKLLNLPYSFLLLLIGSVVYLVLYYFTKKYSVSPFLTFELCFCLGIIPSGFNIMRQFLAFAFFLLAIDKLIQNKNIEYILYCLIASLCHNTAIVLVPLFFIRYIKLSYKSLIVIMTLTIISIFALPYFVKFISKFTNKNYYEDYIVTGLFNGRLNVVYIIYEMVMVLCFIWFYYFRRYIIDINDKKRYDIFLFVFLMAVAVRMIATFSGFIIITNRLLVYFFWSLAFIIPYTIKYFPFKKLRNCYTLCAIFVSLIYFYITIVTLKQCHIIPYLTIFEIGSVCKCMFYAVFIVILILIEYICYIKNCKISRFKSNMDSCIIK